MAYDPNVCTHCAQHVDACECVLAACGHLLSPEQDDAPPVRNVTAARTVANVPITISKKDSREGETRLRVRLWFLEAARQVLSQWLGGVSANLLYGFERFNLQNGPSLHLCHPPQGTHLRRQRWDQMCISLS